MSDLMYPTIGDKHAYFWAKGTTKEVMFLEENITGDGVNKTVYDYFVESGYFALLNGLLANRPPAGGHRVYLADDAERAYFDTGTRWIPIGSDVYNVLDYGAVCDGVTNDTVAIQEAIIDCAASGGGAVLIPGGKEVFFENVEVVGNNVSIQSPLGAKIIAEPVGISAILFTGDGCTIQDLEIDCQNLGQDAVRFSGVIGGRVNNLKVANSPGAGLGIRAGSTGIKIDGLEATNCYYSLLMADSFNINAINVNGDSSQAVTSFEGSLYITACENVKVRDSVFSNSQGHGGWIGGATSNYLLSGVDFISSGLGGGERRGLTVDGAFKGRLSNLYIEISEEVGLYLSSTTSGLLMENIFCFGSNVGNHPGGHGIEVLSSHTSLSNCWGIDSGGNAVNEGSGIYVGGDHITISGGGGYGNWSNGMRIFDATHVTVNGGVYRDNNVGAGTGDGIQIGATALGLCDTIVVSGVNCYGTNRYGISDSAFSTNITYGANNVEGNTVDGLVSTSPSAQKVVMEPA